MSGSARDASRLRGVRQDAMTATAAAPMMPAVFSTGHGRMNRVMWIDAAILAAGVTFICFLVARALNLLVLAL